MGKAKSNGVIKISNWRTMSKDFGSNLWIDIWKRENIWKTYRVMAFLKHG